MIQNSKWISALVTVAFDIEEGQLVDKVVPEGFFSETEKQAIAYNSFPDSVAFGGEGVISYTFMLKRYKENGDTEILHCFNSFMQKRDSNNERGFFQKSLVLITPLKLYNLFKKISGDICIECLEDDSNLDRYYTEIQETWPDVFAQSIIEVSLGNFSYTVKAPPGNKKMAFSDKCLEIIQLSPGNPPKQEIDQDQLKEDEEMNLEDALHSNHHTQGDFQDINIFRLMTGRKVMLWYKLWEIIMLGESLLIVADSPSVCSEMIYGLLGIVAPFVPCTEYFPYLTVFEHGLDDIEERIKDKKSSVLVGVTNPVFLKQGFSETENILRLDDDFAKEKISKNLILKSIRTNTFLTSKKQRLIKNDESLLALFNKDSSTESSLINNIVLRKKLSNMSYSVFLLIKRYFQRQQNVDKISLLLGLKDLQETGFLVIYIITQADRVDDSIQQPFCIPEVYVRLHGDGNLYFFHKPKVQHIHTS